MRTTLTFVLPLVAIAALVVGLPTGSANPEDGWRLDQRIPATSLGWISVEDIGGMDARFQKTAIAGLAKDPEIQAFFKPIGAFLEGMMEEQGGPMAGAPPIFMDLLQQLQGLQGQLGIAIVGVERGQPMPQIVAGMDFGTNVQDFVTFLGRVRDELGEDGDAIQVSQRDGRTWWQVDTGGPVISATIVDTAFVVATSESLLEHVVTGKGASSLGQTPAYKHCHARSGGKDLAMFAFANVPAILGTVGEQMPDEVRQIADGLGLDTVHGASYGMAFRGDGFMDTFVVHTPEANHGLAAMALVPSAAPKLLAHVPEGAFYYSESSMDPSTLMGHVRKLVGTVEPRMVARMDEGIADMSRALGVDIEAELLAGLAPGMGAWATMPEAGGLYPELVLSMAVKEASYEQTFQRFTDGLAGMLTEQGGIIATTRTMDYHGQTLHLFELQEARGDDPIPFTPTWMVKDGRIWMTLVPYTMKDVVLRGLERSTSPGLAGQEDFKALMALRPANAGGQEYMDLQAGLSLAYGTLVPLAQTMVKPNMMGDLPFELDFAALPPLRKVRPFFRSMMSHMSWTNDGIEMSIHAPVPIIALVAVAAGAFTFAMMRGMGGGMGNARALPPGVSIGGGDMQREMAQIQGGELVRYVRLYILEKNKLPGSLKDLVESKVLRTLPKDPWNKDFHLRVLDGATREFAIVSAGPDGVVNTADDIVVAGD